MKLALKTSLIHTGYFRSEINNSLKFLDTPLLIFYFFFAVRYFRENTVVPTQLINCKRLLFAQMTPKHSVGIVAWFRVMRNIHCCQQLNAC